jgi:hypothetical protein
MPGTDDRDWEAEMAKIDRQIASTSPEKLAAAAPVQAAPERRALPAAGGASVGGTAATHKHRPMAAWARLVLALALGVGIVFWPYPHGCGLGLAVYLVGLTTLVAGGVWSAVWTWRHRTPRAHILALLLILEGLTLAGFEVLPRIGYAKADATHPATWSCS